MSWYKVPWVKLKCLLKKQCKKCKSWLFKNIKATLETINIAKMKFPKENKIFNKQKTKK